MTKDIKKGGWGFWLLFTTSEATRVLFFLLTTVNFWTSRLICGKVVLLLFSLDAHAGCQIEDTQQERVQLTMEDFSVLIFLWSQSFLDEYQVFFTVDRVESTVSDLVCLLAPMAAIRCVFCQLATRGVKILLGKLAVGGVTQKHTFQHKTQISKQNNWL